MAPRLLHIAVRELREERLPNPQTLDRDGLVAFVASMGWVADVPGRRAAAARREGEVAPLPEGVYRRLWRTHVHWKRLGG